MNFIRLAGVTALIAGSFIMAAKPLSAAPLSGKLDLSGLAYFDNQSISFESGSTKVISGTDSFSGLSSPSIQNILVGATPINDFLTFASSPIDFTLDSVDSFQVIPVSSVPNSPNFQIAVATLSGTVTDGSGDVAPFTGQFTVPSYDAIQDVNNPNIYTGKLEVQIDPPADPVPEPSEVVGTALVGLLGAIVRFKKTGLLATK